jgi:MFS family permease
MSAIVVTDQYIKFFDNPAGVIQGAIGSALAAGSVVGSAVAGPLSDKIGRRDSIMFACLFWLIGTSVQVACQNTGQLIAGRVLNGFTVGITSSQVPVYLAEIAKAEKRGSLVIIQQLAIEFGILIMYFIGYGCASIEGTASFRTAWGTQFIPCFFLILGLPFLPRSPRWLAKVGRDKEAIETLANIQAGGNVNDPLVIAEWEEIQTVMNAEREAGPGWEKFFRRGMWKRTLAGMSVQAWQVSHPPEVESNDPVLIRLATRRRQRHRLLPDLHCQHGWSDRQRRHGHLGHPVCRLHHLHRRHVVCIGLSLLPTIKANRSRLFIDKTGRRTLLIWGAIGMGFCHFVVGGVMGAHSIYVPEGVGGNANIVIKVDSGAPANTVITFSYLLIVVYALTLAPVCWIYAAEVWSLGTRATGMSLAALSNWVFNFALGMFTPPAFVNITWKLFIIFGVLCIAAAAWFFVLCPETCGKTLEEVELLFSKDGPWAWNTKKGESRLAAEIEAVAARQKKGEHEGAGPVSEVEKV